MKRWTGHEAHSERAIVWRYIWLAVGVVFVQRSMLAVNNYMALSKEHVPVSLYNLFIHGYSHWDGTWYVLLAQTGYTRLKDTAFWPVYPWSIRGLHSMTHLTYPTCGIIISLFSFVFVLFFLGLLVRREFSDRTAIVAILLLAFFPTAYYLDAVYTESMFLALCLGAAYFTNRHNFWTAGCFTGLAALTRNTGILMLLILAFEYIRWRQMGWRFWRPDWWRKIEVSLLGLLIPLVTLGLYCIWLKVKFGNYFAFLQAERFWHRTYMWPWLSFRHTVGQWLHPHSTIMKHSYVQFEAASFVVACFMLLLGIRYAWKSLSHAGWWLYMLVLAWVASSEPAMNIPDYLLSFPRFVLMLFPGFAFLADSVRPRWLVLPILGIFVWYLLGKSGQFFFGEWIA